MSDTYVLSTEEKNRIVAEESLRISIRNDLQPQKISKENKIWTFLNSNFGLWFMSAVFVTGIGSFISNQQAINKENKQKAEEKQQKVKIDEERNYTENKRRADRISRISMEISYRLSTAMIKLETVGNMIDGNRKENVEALMTEALAPLSRPTTSTFSPLFPEFANYSGLALIAELQTISIPGNQSDINNKLTALSGLIVDPRIREIRSKGDIEKFAGELIEKTRYKSWDNGFYYTDCSKSRPFC